MDVLHGVYAIADLPRGADAAGAAALVGRTAEVLAGGARLVQCRAKHASPALRRAFATDLRELTRRHAALLIVNDDAELALATGADGVHVGRDDGGVARARLIMGPRALIGASCYASLDLAWDAVAAGADYLAFGSAFASPTKPDAPRVAPAVLREAVTTLPLPVCAIGGITADNVSGLLATGVRLVAVASGLYAAPDPRAATARLVSLIPPGAPGSG